MSDPKGAGDENCGEVEDEGGEHGGVGRCHAGFAARRGDAAGSCGSWQVLRHEYNGTNTLHYDNYPQPPSAPLDVTEQWSVIGSTGGGTSGASGYPKGSAGWRQSSGSVRTIWKWQRNLNAQGQPDPNDNPPSELIVRIAVSASAAAASDTRTGAPNRMPGKEHVDATAMGETGEMQDANNRKSSSVTVVRLMRLPTGNQEQVEGP